MGGTGGDALDDRGRRGVAGLIQIWEEAEPKYRHAGIDLFLDPRWHGRGLGTEAVRRTLRHLVEDLGHHRVTIDPATTNLAAIRAYEKVGFRRVGVTRRSERDADGDGVARLAADGVRDRHRRRMKGDATRSPHRPRARLGGERLDATQ